MAKLEVDSWVALDTGFGLVVGKYQGTDRDGISNQDEVVLTQCLRLQNTPIPVQGVGGVRLEMQSLTSRMFPWCGEFDEMANYRVPVDRIVGYSMVPDAAIDAAKSSMARAAGR